MRFSATPRAAFPRLLPRARRLLLAAIAVLGTASAYAQLGQGSGSSDQGAGFGSSQPSVTTTRSGFGTRTTVDYGTGPTTLGNGAIMGGNGQPCAGQFTNGGQFGAGSGGGSSGSVGNIGSAGSAGLGGGSAGAGGFGGSNNNGASGTNGTTNLAPCPQNGPQSQNPNGQQFMQAPPPYVPGEFELYVQSLEPMMNVRRLGADLMQPQPGPDISPLVPPDYLISPGDELDIAIWGSVDAQAPVIVDRTGRITLPRVGTIMVGGVRYADLPGLLTREVARQFRNFKLSVSLGQLRGMRVYVTGFVPRPGSYTVSSLATVSSVLIGAGGPTAAGSFRDIEVRRHGEVVSKFDLYDLISTGKRSADIVLQPDDVVHVGPVGPQVAILGSVNQPAIVELKPGDDLAAAIRLTGGLSSVADGSHITIEPLSDRTRSRVVLASISKDGNRELDRGDVVNVYSAVDARQPTTRQNKRIVVEGEVTHPGVFVLPPNASIADALQMAGGFTSNAYIYGTEFTRESVRISQQQQYNKLLQDLQVDMQQNIATHLVASADDAKAQDARANSAERLVDELRKIQPTGRMVLLTDPAAKSLPPMQVEDGDRLYVPPVATTVGVFGSVFTAGNFVYSDSRRIGDYLDMAGGAKRGADKDSEFVLRANGSVVSNLQGAGWFHSGRLNEMPALPGDTIYMPEELNKMTGLEISKAWSEIVFQLGLGLAGISAATR